MGKSIKKPVKYHGVGVPVPLIEEMKVYVKNNQYRSVSSFVQEAIREKMIGKGSRQEYENKYDRFNHLLNEALEASLALEMENKKYMDITNALRDIRNKTFNKRMHIALTPEEEKYVDEYCKKNNCTFSDLVGTWFKRDIPKK